MLVVPVAFAVTLGFAIAASRLRSVAGLAALAVIAFAATSDDARGAILRAALPAALAVLTADAIRVRRSAEWRAARTDARPSPRPAARPADGRPAA